MWCPVLWVVTRGKADVTAFGYMLELAQGTTSWWNPLLGGMAPETDGLLPHWLGALVIQWLLQGSPRHGGTAPFAGCSSSR